MATKISNAEDGWRVRLADGEYELSLSELGQWIDRGIVTYSSHVRPPTTRRWKLVEHTPELEPFFTAKWQRDNEERWKVEAPMRQAAAERAARAKGTASGVGCGIGVAGLALLFTGTELGIVAGVFAGAIGLIIFIIARASS